MAKRKLVHKNKCIFEPGETFGSKRYRYKAWWCMSPAERSRAAGRYPHKARGIPDSAYAYPIKKDGSPARAERTLLWSYEHDSLGASWYGPVVLRFPWPKKSAFDDDPRGFDQYVTPDAIPPSVIDVWDPSDGWVRLLPREF